MKLIIRSTTGVNRKHRFLMTNIDTWELRPKARSGLHNISLSYMTSPQIASYTVSDKTKLLMIKFQRTSQELCRKWKPASSPWFKARLWPIEPVGTFSISYVTIVLNADNFHRISWYYHSSYVRFNVICAPVVKERGICRRVEPLVWLHMLGHYLLDLGYLPHST